MPACPLMYHGRAAVLCIFRRKRQHSAAPDPPLGRRMVHMADSSDVSRLVRASADGSTEAWSALVHRYAPLVMAVARSYQLTAADAQDVSQTVWLRLVEHLANLREPEALPGWLVTTTQRECRHHDPSGPAGAAGRSAGRRGHAAAARPPILMPIYCVPSCTRCCATALPSCPRGTSGCSGSVRLTRRSPIRRSASCLGCRSGVSARPSSAVSPGCGKPQRCGPT